MRLEQLLANPSDEYYPVPWWAWTGKLEPDLMRRQLRMMREQGIREFFIFPIYGMVPEYMSDDYLDRIGWTLDWCRELGMKVWIYDELNWPSGTAAGLVARRHPDAIAANLSLELHAASEVSLDEAKNSPEVVHAAKVGEQVAVYRRVKDRTVNITVKGCLWTKNDPGMLDLLSKKAVAAFIEEAYEPTARRFPHELGKTIKGFFTDEPSIAPGHIPWTDELPDRFRTRFGYDLVENLQDLNFDSPTSRRTRANYWQLVAEMSSEAYTGQIARWCEDHNLLLTGHMVWEEDSHSVWYQGDSPMHQMKMQVPGCDLLQTPTNFDDDPGWYVTNVSLVKVPKDPASAARYTDRKRVMCEAYGVMPWYKTMTDEKRLTDWLVALGVNLINDNSLISDISGFRKRAISGKHFTQPWWPYAHLYYDYAARISALSAETRLDAQTAVLYPSTTWWSMTVRAQEPSPELRALETAFDNALDALVRTHWDFEMLFEDVLADAAVEGGKLAARGCEFRAVVAAGVNLLRPEAARKLEEFAESGGTVILVGSEIECIEKDSFRPLPLPQAIRLTDTSRDSLTGQLEARLGERVERFWRIQGAGSEGVISAARVADDGRRLLFLANMTPGDKDLEVSWNGSEPVELWDADSAARWTPTASESQKKCCLALPDGQSVWFVQSPDASSETLPPPHFVSVRDAAPLVELDGPWTFWTDRPNLHKLEFKLLPDAEGRIEFGSPELASDEGWVEVVDDDAGMPLGSDSMKRYWLKSQFELARPLPGLRIVGDSGDVEKVYLNGVDLGESVQETVWDDENRAWEAGDAARAGRNEVLMRVKASPYNSEPTAIFPKSIVEPAVLMGWFRVDPETGALGRMPDTLGAGDIRKLGFRHFVGVCVYQADFTWPGPEGPALIMCDAGRDVVEVAVDGHALSLGRRAWGRRAFRIDSLAPGKHRLLVRAANTLGAILTRTYNAELTPDIPPSGLLAPVRLYQS